MFSIPLIFSIDPQTQDFLREIVRVYTPADLAALADVKVSIDKTKARLDLIDQHLQTKEGPTNVRSQ